MHEIVTLQFGEYANYVGNHFWNIQQAYPSEEGEVAEPQVGARQAPNHTLLYRESETRGYGRTFTPRLLIYDLKENLGSLSSYSGISASSTQPPTDFQTQTHHEETWDQPAQLCAQEMIQSAPFIKRWESPDPDAPVHQPLEPDTHYWTDFSENFFHPRTFSPHFSTLAVNGGLNGFAEFQQGRDLFRYQLTQGELNEDNLRFFVEESDYLQGFQIIANANDGFAGYTAAYVEYLRDEFPKEPVLVFGAAHVAEA
ncbi:Tubulin/FtsZ, GTPase domain-containing protein, partial [Dimargaris cristalligena]